MKFLPLLKTCIRALVRNPMRAALTILGIIIGIAAVIAMVEIGQGSTLQIKNTIASMGADTLNIRPCHVAWLGLAPAWAVVSTRSLPIIKACERLIVATV